VKSGLAAQVGATTAVSVVQVVQFLVISVGQLRAVIQVVGDLAYRKTCPRGR